MAPGLVSSTFWLNTQGPEFDTPISREWLRNRVLGAVERGGGAVPQGRGAPRCFIYCYTEGAKEGDGGGIPSLIVGGLVLVYVFLLISFRLLLLALTPFP